MDLFLPFYVLGILLVLAHRTTHQGLVGGQVVEGIAIGLFFLKSKVRIDITFVGVGEKRVEIVNMKVFA